MEFALFNLMSQHSADDVPAAILTNAVDQVRLADDLGFDVAWFAEHHFSSHSVCASPLMMAAACASVTKRIRLGPAVVVLPLHHPLRVVQEVGMLDALSGGRVVLGLGTGHQPHEFRTYGVPIHERVAILEEGWDIVEQGLTQGKVAHTGTYFSIPSTPIVGLKQVAGMPPTYLAGGDAHLLRRAARKGTTPLVSQGFKLPEAMSRARALVDESFAEGGWQGRAPLGLQRYIFITDDPAEARIAAQGVLRMARTALSLRDEIPPREGAWLRSVPFETEPTLDWLLEHSPIGPASKVADILARDIALLHPTHMSLYMGFTPFPQPRVMTAIERFGTEVLPLLKGT
ncbi:LLM class flavin-dependent oxidoreductase [Acidisphaera sp. L21]|uniref:LLM class flavin-dependent oxidoreductase n=1 Tax=Acidisphaera sp. L21 TaxID=1641851 RepID=UPI00131E6A69|nr:LLM class flavin-dependent oxidoreductase [Acidisphaera sp. L21]